MTNNISKTNLKEIENQLKDIVLTAGEMIMRKWDNIGHITYKDKRDVVTEVDVEVENFLREKLHQILPEAGFIVEEGKTEKKSIYNWAIDPLDGTKYYCNLTPMFVTQLALVKNDTPVLGMVYQPVSKQLFSASRGNGAFLNDQPLPIGKIRSKLNESILNLDFGISDKLYVEKFSLIKKICNKFYRFRSTGGFLFPYLLTGAIDAHLNLDNKIKLVDYLPPWAIIQEAGFKIEKFSVNNLDVILAANPVLFEKIKTLIISR